MVGSMEVLRIVDAILLKLKFGLEESKRELGLGD